MSRHLSTSLWSIAPEFCYNWASKALVSRHFGNQNYYTTKFVSEQDANRPLHFSRRSPIRCFGAACHLYASASACNTMWYYLKTVGNYSSCSAYNKSMLEHNMAHHGQGTAAQAMCYQVKSGASGHNRWSRVVSATAYFINKRYNRQYATHTPVRLCNYQQ